MTLDTFMRLFILPTAMTTLPEAHARLLSGMGDGVVASQAKVLLFALVFFTFVWMMASWAMAIYKLNTWIVGPPEVLFKYGLFPAMVLFAAVSLGTFLASRAFIDMINVDLVAQMTALTVLLAYDALKNDLPWSVVACILIFLYLIIK